jgi:uncharacterized protein YbbC (DUF1343 family)
MYTCRHIDRLIVRQIRSQFETEKQSYRTQRQSYWTEEQSLRTERDRVVGQRIRVIIQSGTVEGEFKHKITELQDRGTKLKDGMEEL